MNTEKGKNWKDEVLDELEKFVGSIGPDTAEGMQILLEDEGQANLVWDALKPVFPTCRVVSGDETSALELGKLIGHWSHLWRFMVTSASYLETLRSCHQDLSAEILRLTELLSHPAVEIDEDSCASPLLLLESSMDPAFVQGAIDNNRRFEALLNTVLRFIELQRAEEKDEFMKGYRIALASCPIDENGLPYDPDKLASLLAFCRPAAIRLGMSASSFQEAVDEVAGALITGNPEGFSKRLQRKKASLREKGRPLKKTSDHPTNSLNKIGQILLPGVRFNSESSS